MLFVQNVNGDQTAFKADNVQITDTLGQYPTLSFTFVETPENEVAAQMMIPFTIIEVPENKQRYRIVTNNPVSLGKYKQYSVTAIHIAKDLHNKYVDERLENTQSLKACLDLLIKDTQIKYVLHDNFDNYAFSEGFGGGYADDLLMQNLASDFGFEFYFDNYTIHIQKKLGTKESFLFIDNANVSKISYNEDYSTITTYIKGQAKPIVQETTDETSGSSSSGGSWGWPFPDVGEGNFMQAQRFGYDGGFRPNSFHDGLDFGSVDHPGSAVHAIHSGKVTIKSYMGGLGNYVVIHSDDGYNIVYQEAFSSMSNIRVNVGDVVNTGDVIGYRNTDHLHIGITKVDFNTAVGKSFTNDGTWLNPQEIIRNGIANNNSESDIEQPTETVEEDKPTEYEIHSEYVSPLVEKAHWPKVEAEPITDDNITDENTLLNKLKASIHDYPDIEYTLDYANFKYNSVKFNNDIKVGNYGWLRDRFGIDVEVRINSYTWYPQNKQADTVTFGNKRFDPVEWQVRNQKAFERNKKLGETLKNQISKVQKGIVLPSIQNELEGKLKEYIDDKLNNNTPTNPDTPKPQHIGKIIDVSEWQGVIDWPSVIADDVTLSIIRVQHGSAHQDLKYMENLQKCISAGGKYAVYAYFAATSTSDAQQEARDFYNRTQQVVAGKQQPVFYAIDVESIEMSGDVTQMRAGVEAYMSQLNALGVPDNKIVLYIANHLYDKFNLNVARPGAIWIPSYGQNDGTLANSLKPTHPYDLWQFTSKGSVKGISGNVDMSIEPSEKFKELIFSA
ncbi:phage tail protein [Ligilactobacillus salivarius]|uniref:phage tail protein n=1 Tax=Ligilactobacillus salivarius TaxID=1624 RepID=UPI002150B965|nr:phage tail protein [Ligilactobacillus salivarius]MDH4960306.1 phage tail protein [Ligilactobacillus salivarius]UUY23903.1 phage tail protein [Ligilactobacillus salivarius]